MPNRTTKPTTAEKAQTDLVDNLEKQIESLQSDVHALMKAVNGKVDGQNVIESATEAVAHAAEQTTDEAAKELQKFEALIKDQPLKSVALALGIGAALTFLARS